MDKQTFMEAMGVVALSIVAATLGSIFHVDFLLQTVAPGLFGAALGYLGHSARVGGGS